jgi:VanZ family protein
MASGLGKGRRLVFAVAAWILLAGYSGFIFWMSSGPVSVPTPGWLPSPDKFLHLGAYAVWGGICAVALRLTGPGIPRRLLLGIAAIAGALYGLTDEFHQSFIPSRDADVLDLIADAVGSLVGAWVAVRLSTLVGLGGPRGSEPE